jgi:c-di-GMP-binding flagellar brake protein YcgR
MKPAASIDAQPAAALKQEGRRQHTRLPYTGKATIARIGTPQLHQAVVIDLSISGCLLRLCDRTDVEVDDVADISLQSADISFRARGSVRHVRNAGQLVGIHFDNLTQRGKAALQQLIAELEASG